jgi:YggT family protein
VITILYQILNEILNLYKWAVILAAVFSMLVSFGVLDTRNRLVWTIGDFLYRVTEPALRPIRNMLPNFGGVGAAGAAHEGLSRRGLWQHTGPVPVGMRR